VLVDTYGSALAAVLAERPSIVKVNAAEASEAAGLDVDGYRAAVVAATSIRASGAAAAIVTLGVEGAVLASAAGTWRLAPPAVRGSYPVGSGDAVLGGLAVGLSAGRDLADAMRVGLAAGAANALIPGAGELDPADVARLIDTIEARPV
jgi:fructose-1-phosphate kinase PfkB-like protein